jgi:Fur family peroxide stress response transcriptional regulator
LTRGREKTVPPLPWVLVCSRTWGDCLLSTIGERVEPKIVSDVDEKLARLVVELKRRGYRVTAQRLAIAKIVFENIKNHPSFMEILEAVRQRMPSISPSTIYNNLQLLEQMGFIKSFDVAGETRYDDAHLHVNLVCIDKASITDLDDDKLVRDVAEYVKKKYGANVYEVVVYAKCSNSEGSKQ